MCIHALIVDIIHVIVLHTLTYISRLVNVAKGNYYLPNMGTFMDVVRDNFNG